MDYGSAPDRRFQDLLRRYPFSDLVSAAAVDLAPYLAFGDLVPCENWRVTYSRLGDDQAAAPVEGPGNWDRQYECSFRSARAGVFSYFDVRGPSADFDNPEANDFLELDAEVIHPLP